MAREVYILALHTLEVRGLCLMKLSTETIQNLAYVRRIRNLKYFSFFLIRAPGRASEE